MKIGPDATCARCGRPADGYATINGERYCHGDDPEPSCYMRQSWANSTRGERPLHDLYAVAAEFGVDLNVPTDRPAGDA